MRVAPLWLRSGVISGADGGAGGGVFGDRETVRDHGSGDGAGDAVLAEAAVVGVAVDGDVSASDPIDADGVVPGGEGGGEGGGDAGVRVVGEDEVVGGVVDRRGDVEVDRSRRRRW